MKFKKNNIFSPFFIKTNLKEDFESIRDEILSVIISNYNTRKNNDTWWGIHTDEKKPSTNFKDCKELNYEKIIPIYIKYLKEYCKKNLNKKYNIEINDIWYVVYGKGKEASIHQHDSGAGEKNFSCIHYFKFDPKIHNPVTFCSHRRVLNRYYTNKNIKFKGIDYFNEECTPDAIQDDLIIFPSETYHRVKKNESDELRITICFNVKLI